MWWNDIKEIKQCLGKLTDQFSKIDRNTKK